MTSKCGKNKRVAREAQKSVSRTVLPDSSLIYYCTDVGQHDEVKFCQWKNLKCCIKMRVKLSLSYSLYLANLGLIDLTK